VILETVDACVVSFNWTIRCAVIGKVYELYTYTLKHMKCR